MLQNRATHDHHSPYAPRQLQDTTGVRETTVVPHQAGQRLLSTYYNILPSEDDEDDEDDG